MGIVRGTFAFYRDLLARLGLKQFDGILSIVASSFDNNGKQPGLLFFCGFEIFLAVFVDDVRGRFAFHGITSNNPILAL